MDDINLDYDDDLSSDASQFELTDVQRYVLGEFTQGDALPTGLPVHLVRVLHVAREVYGETNSKQSGVFHRWVQDILEGGTTIRETREMLSLLYEERDDYALRMNACLRHADGLRAEQYRKRRQAVICAQMVVRAVLNKFRGLPYTLWLNRCLWRATQAEGDMRGSSLKKR